LTIKTKRTNKDYLYILKRNIKDPTMINLLNEYELAFGQLPDEPESNQVLYLESHRNMAFESYITTHLDKVKRIFSEHGLEFIYLPDMLDNMPDEDLLQAARYYAPWMKSTDADTLRNACRISIDQLYQKVRLKDDDPAVVDSRGRAFKVDVSNPRLYDVLFYQMAEAYSPRSRRESRVYSRINKMPAMVEECTPREATASDTTIDDEYYRADRLYRELKQKYSGWVLEAMLASQLRREEVLSTVVIDSPRRLLLPQYNNMEIKLTPATMAFYLLYLKHPEGIKFKELIDHRQELYRLYSYTTRSSNMDSIAHTVDIMVSQLDGNQDVQRSRIKAAIRRNFDAHFSQETARWYYLDGKRGEPMKIAIAGEPGKVIWQTDL